MLLSLAREKQRSIGWSDYLLRLHRIPRSRVPHRHAQFLALRSAPVALHLRVKHPRRDPHLELLLRKFFPVLLRIREAHDNTTQHQQTRANLHANSLSLLPEIESTAVHPRDIALHIKFSCGARSAHIPSLPKYWPLSPRAIKLPQDRPGNPRVAIRIAPIQKVAVIQINCAL